MGTTHLPAGTGDKFDRVWATLSSADRLVLLGHDRPGLTPADKVRLAAAARKLRHSVRAVRRDRRP